MILAWTLTGDGSGLRISTATTCLAGAAGGGAPSPRTAGLARAPPRADVGRRCFPFSMLLLTLVFGRPPPLALYAHPIPQLPGNTSPERRRRAGVPRGGAGG